MSLFNIILNKLNNKTKSLMPLKNKWHFKTAWKTDPIIVECQLQVYKLHWWNIFSSIGLEALLVFAWLLTPTQPLSETQTPGFNICTQRMSLIYIIVVYMFQTTLSFSTKKLTKGTWEYQSHRRLIYCLQYTVQVEDYAWMSYKASVLSQT